MDAKETSIYTAILITAAVLGTIIIYFIISIIRHQRRNMELHKQNILAEITQIEKERARIAADLHDEIGPLLSAIKMKINSFDLTHDEDKVQVERTNSHINDILKRIREISFNLMPNSLLRKGLVIAVKEFTDYLNNNSDTQFTFYCANGINPGEEKSVNIYRMVQEIVHNAIKHAKASRLDIEMSQEKNILLLSVSDNGKGFDYEKQSKENHGFGLRSLLRRTEMMGGQMYLESQPGKGTNYSFEIPL